MIKNITFFELNGWNEGGGLPNKSDNDTVKLWNLSYSPKANRKSVWLLRFSSGKRTHMMLTHNSTIDIFGQDLSAFEHTCPTYGSSGRSTIYTQRVNNIGDVRQRHLYGHAKCVAGDCGIEPAICEISGYTYDWGLHTCMCMYGQQDFRVCYLVCVALCHTQTISPER